MLKFRVVKTGSGKIAKQVFYLKNRKRVIVKHLGSESTPEAIKVVAKSLTEWQNLILKQVQYFIL